MLEICCTRQFPVTGKKCVLVARVVAHLESITDFETDSLNIWI